MSNDKQTPLMRQYTQIKAKYPDTVLFFRMGDFFETFNEDAEITAQVCNIALTKRNNGAAGDMPLAGFPHHQLDAYLPKLVRAGYRVAVCEQLEDPKFAKGIVKRDVIEVVTPGAALYEKLLENKKNNYIASVYVAPSVKDRLKAGLAFADISTGEFFTSEVDFREMLQVLETLNPSEILISKEQKHELLPEVGKLSYQVAVTKLEPWIFDIEFGKEAVLGHFKTKSLKGFGIEDYTLGLAAAGAILNYINETQKTQLSHIKNIYAYNSSDFMFLDYATRRNLEITFSNNENTKEGSLIAILDKTCTPMGGRLLKKWIAQPLTNTGRIRSRLEAVRVLKDGTDGRASLRNLLNNFGDLERIIQKICTGRANPRDVVYLQSSLALIPSIITCIGEFSLPSLNTIAGKLNPLPELIAYIGSAILEDPSTSVGSGNVFRRGFNSELDEYLEAKHSGKKLLEQMQETERAVTGISSLKISYNNVFGYYIEVTNTHKSKVPDNYMRKQTLSNAERYTTPELKEFETKILNAEEKIAGLEQELFNTVRLRISDYTEAIQENAFLVASVDCLQSYAEASALYNYTEPTIDDSGAIEIIDGRHPVVERLLPIGRKYTPNSTKLSPDSEQIHIITGPNMSGKSCYLRQTALIILMGQIGCFVPAHSAHFGLIDRIFTRVGAQDNITAGESTFLVEMQETANILNNATSKSLILLDEVGRGTATFDGISIAWSITEHIHNNIGAKTLFATHYHELNDLAARYDHIANYQIEVVETGNTIIFTHNVKPGGADHSFGIHVAQMAGLPEEVTNRANLIMKSFEGDNGEVNLMAAKTPDVSVIETKKSNRINEQLSIFELRDDKIREKLKDIEINNITPVSALQILSELVKEVKADKKRKKS